MAREDGENGRREAQEGCGPNPCLAHSESPSVSIYRVCDSSRPCSCGIPRKITMESMWDTQELTDMNEKMTKVDKRWRQEQGGQVKDGT